MSEVVRNKVVLVGHIKETPVFSHSVMGEDFYSSSLKVCRLSDNGDVLPILISDRLVDISSVQVDDCVKMVGQFRSYNMHNGDSSSLILNVFVTEFEKATEDDCILSKRMNNEVNIITLEGSICKPTHYRITPRNSEVCDILLAVNRVYYKSDYIPCIAWNRNAKYAQNLNVDDKVKVSGRVQSREYNKQQSDGSIVKKTAYEVSIFKIELMENESSEDKAVSE